MIEQGYPASMYEVIRLNEAKEMCGMCSKWVVSAYI